MCNWRASMNIIPMKTRVRILFREIPHFLPIISIINHNHYHQFFPHIAIIIIKKTPNNTLPRARLISKSIIIFITYPFLPPPSLPLLVVAPVTRFSNFGSLSRYLHVPHTPTQGAHTPEPCLGFLLLLLLTQNLIFTNITCIWAFLCILSFLWAASVDLPFCTCFVYSHRPIYLFIFSIIIFLRGGTLCACLSF